MAGPPNVGPARKKTGLTPGRTSDFKTYPPAAGRQGQSMASATKSVPALKIKMSERMRSPGDAGGVGGGVVSRKPAARGGRSSVIYGTPPITDSTPKRKSKRYPIPPVTG
jgi:hypothetical protein